MSLPLEEIEARVVEDIHKITLEATKSLRDIWLQTFDSNTCEANIKKLSDHVKLFYDEIIQETEERRQMIQNAISDLQKEALDLKRLLKVDISLTPPKSVPLYTIQINMDQKLQTLRENVKKRKDEILELQLEQEALCEELNESPKELCDDPMPSDDELFDFRLHLNALKAEKNNRVFLITNYRKDIQAFMEELEMPIRTQEENYLLNDKSLPLSQLNIDRLKSLREQFIDQMEETRESIENMKLKLEKIWEFLDASPRTRNKFAKYTNYSQTTYDRFYMELNRCEGIKRQNIKLFVDKCRDEISKWWDKTMKSEAERSRFTHFSNDLYTEDLLALHEIELEEIKRFYEENEQIFNLINERNILWERMQALESKYLEPGRYNNRGGQLLKEEKERKTISNKLPKIEETLKGLVQQYETANNRKFTIYGEDILELIQMQWDEKRVQKEKHINARKGTPVLVRNNSIRAPMSLRNPINTKCVTSIKKFPSTANLINGSSVPLSNKRKLPASEKMLPSSKRNLLSQFEGSRGLFKANMKKIKPVIATPLKRRSARLSSGKKRHSRNKKNYLPKIKVNDETQARVYSSDTTDYDNFEEYIQKEPKSKSSLMYSSESTICSVRGNRRNIENTAINKRNATTMLKMVKTPTKVQLNEHYSIVTKRDITTRSRAVSPAVGSASNKKLTTKNLPIII